MINIDYNAYWISPKGHIYPVKIKHIDTIFDIPEEFGLTSEELYKIFDSFNEPYRYEGKARRQILENIIKNGWIRLRKKSNSNTWTINISNIDNIQKKLIDKWVYYMKEKEFLHKNDDLIIIDLSGNKAKL